MDNGRKSVCLLIEGIHANVLSRCNVKDKYEIRCAPYRLDKAPLREDCLYAGHRLRQCAGDVGCLDQVLEVLHSAWLLAFRLNANLVPVRYDDTSYLHHNWLRCVQRGQYTNHQ